LVYGAARVGEIPLFCEATEGRQKNRTVKIARTSNLHTPYKTAKARCEMNNDQGKQGDDPLPTTPDPLSPGRWMMTIPGWIPSGYVRKPITPRWTISLIRVEP
jgi:hypothetical protein